MPKAKRKFFTVCPKCGSLDVSSDFSNPALVATGLINNAKVCNNCGYSSYFFPEKQIDKKKSRESKKSKTSNKKKPPQLRTHPLSIKPKILPD